MGSAVFLVLRGHHVRIKARSGRFSSLTSPPTTIPLTSPFTLPSVPLEPPRPDPLCIPPVARSLVISPLGIYRGPVNCLSRERQPFMRAPSASAWLSTGIPPAKSQSNSPSQVTNSHVLEPATLTKIHLNFNHLANFPHRQFLSSPQRDLSFNSHPQLQPSSTLHKPANPPHVKSATHRARPELQPSTSTASKTPQITKYTSSPQRIERDPSTLSLKLPHLVHSVTAA
ncbi:hypothetical protein B0H16DRAFT_1456873 [Mycena metata]|uniref:Uncharacterized protein n=1 Tax=Mycena metata TaxID=1033252 RepID=A0AAD7JCD9_9AGAR|nr:hypothetical protein B0H16DRAFT_1456873 [Mycena metata]